MEEFSLVLMKRFRSNWFEKKKGHHVTYNTRKSIYITYQMTKQEEFHSENDDIVFAMFTIRNNDR